MPKAEVRKASKRVHCSNCGAELLYAPGTDHLLCPYCQTENTIDHGDLKVEERELEEYLNRELALTETESHQAIECNSCGSITSFDDRTKAKMCGFCGNHLLLKDAHSFTQVKVHALLPFSVDHREAHKHFRAWINKLWFAPNKLKHMANAPEDLQGIYIPYWTFDAQTNTDYNGQRGDAYYVTETYKSGGETRTRQKRKIRWSPRSGHIDHFFDDVLVLASKSLPEKQAHKLAPWDLEQVLPFKEDYLRGFKVENYRIELTDAFTNAKKRMIQDIDQLIRRDIGGDEQRISHKSTNWSELRFKHILLPVFIASYPFKGKTYRFLINGRTGEVQGERPYSAIKITLLVLAILVIVLLIVLFTK